MQQPLSMEKVFPDPVLSAFELPLRRTFYPLGFPLELQTNSAEVIAAASEGSPLAVAELSLGFPVAGRAISLDEAIAARFAGLPERALGLVEIVAEAAPLL